MPRFSVWRIVGQEGPAEPLTLQATASSEAAAWAWVDKHQEHYWFLDVEPDEEEYD